MEKVFKESNMNLLDNILEEVRAGNVNQVSSGDLHLFKYSANCVHEELWNETSLKCRGIVLNDSGKIIARPYDKFFNLNEREDTSTSQILNKLNHGPFSITEKLDGSCISIWFYNGSWRASTPGSFQSEQAIYAMEELFPLYNLDNLCKDYTYMCELIAPWNRIVIDYGGRTELVMITAFKNSWEINELSTDEVDLFATSCGMSRVREIRAADLSEFLERDVPEGEEGYVVRFSDGSRIKLKGQWYFKLHRLVGSLSLKNVLEIVKDGTYKDAVKDVPDYIKDDFDDIYSQIMTVKKQIDTEVSRIWLSTLKKLKNLDDFKACAAIFTKHETSSILFAMMREKYDLIEGLTWKLVAKRLDI